MIFNKMKAPYLSFIFLLVFCLSAFAQKHSETCYKNINSDDFNLLIETKDILLIDVRLHKEFRKERIKNAYLASSRELLKALLEKIDKNTNILVYCEDGDRSETASQIICKEMNFNKVYNLKGGIIQWKKRGYAIDNTQLKKTQLNSN